MKIILFIVAFFSINLFAGYPKTHEIYFKFLDIDTSQMGNELCDSIYLGSLSSDRQKYRRFCWVDGSDMEYNSPLDYSVVFYFSAWGYGDGSFLEVRRTNQTCTDSYQGKVEGTPGTAQFSEVLFAELMRLQQYGVIKNDCDSLETYLKTAIEKMKDVSPCDDIDLAFYDEDNEAYYVIGPGCCSLVNSSQNALPTILFDASNIHVVKMGTNRFYLQNTENGTAYTLFDLNGKVLKQGRVVSGIVQTPMLPVVLKIHNQIFRLK
jgi:hypothetical protein